MEGGTRRNSRRSRSSGEGSGTEEQPKKKEEEKAPPRLPISLRKLFREDVLGNVESTCQNCGWADQNEEEKKSEAGEEEDREGEEGGQQEQKTTPPTKTIRQECKMVRIPRALLVCLPRVSGHNINLSFCDSIQEVTRLMQVYYKDRLILKSKAAVRMPEVINLEAVCRLDSDTLAESLDGELLSAFLARRMSGMAVGDEEDEARAAEAVSPPPPTMQLPIHGQGA